MKEVKEVKEVKEEKVRTNENCQTQPSQEYVQFSCDKQAEYLAQETRLRQLSENVTRDTVSNYLIKRGFRLEVSEGNIAYNRQILAEQVNAAFGQLVQQGSPQLRYAKQAGKSSSVLLQQLPLNYLLDVVTLAPHLFFTAQELECRDGYTGGATISFYHPHLSISFIAIPPKRLGNPDANRISPHSHRVACLTHQAFGTSIETLYKKGARGIRTYKTVRSDTGEEHFDDLQEDVIHSVENPSAGQVSLSVHIYKYDGDISTVENPNLFEYSWNQIIRHQDVVRRTATANTVYYT